MGAGGGASLWDRTVLTVTVTVVGVAALGGVERAIKKPQSSNAAQMFGVVQRVKHSNWVPRRSIKKIFGKITAW